jgi:hypothetical protein
MAEELTPGRASSIDTVIRGFTDAELALREVSGAVERIRSASEQLDVSRADQEAARQTLSGTSAAVDRLGEKVEGTVDGLREVAEVLKRLEPERLWLHLEDHTRAIQAAAEEAASNLGSAVASIQARLDATDANSAAQWSELRERADARADAQRSSERRTRYFIGVVIAVAAVNLVATLALIFGWATLP